MTILETDVLAIIIALTASAGMMLWAIRANYYLQKENLKLRQELLRYTTSKAKGAK
jgi:hypothetical protein